MKQIISFTVQVVAFLANVLTLAAFAYGQNWQIPTLLGFTKFDWALWTGLLGIYSLGTLFAVVLHSAVKRDPEGPSFERGFIITIFIGIPIYLLWWRAFLFDFSIDSALLGAAGAFLSVFMFGMMMGEVLYGQPLS